MRRYLTDDPEYAIATGNKNFDSQQTTGGKNTLAVILAGLNSNNAEVELEQSIDNINWGLLPGSTQILAVGQTCHQWNINGLPGGIYLRVVLRKGTATAGTVKSIKLLSDE